MVKVRDDLAKTTDGRFDLDACVAALCERDHALDAQRLLATCQLLENVPDQGQRLLATGLEFAHLLIELQLDSEAVCAGIVYRGLREQFVDDAAVARVAGRDASVLVRSVVRMSSVSLLELSNTPLLSTESRDQVDNVRKMLVALIDDVRVAIVKLAERIVALRGAKHMHTDRQQRLAQEVLELFSPLANRLGIWRLKWELEDLAFRYTEPAAYKYVAGKFDGRRVEREHQVDAIQHSLEQALRAEGINAEVGGRAKHIYSIWRKMQTKDVGFEEIYDVRAVRVLVDDTRACYAALGVIHTSWRHIASEFDDYIANPKDNGYRSIHTAVLGPDGRTLEVQIRTHEMHRESELGVCAHWSYKESAELRSTDRAYTEKLDWLRQVLAWHEEVGGFTAVGEELRSNIESDRIYVFTPGGHVVDLTTGSTPLDFAYRVHTEIGHHCSGARVNGAQVPLTVALKTGQSVEIITSKSQQPSREWLDSNLGFVRTARAKAKIQSWFRALDVNQNITAGRRQLETDLERLAIRVNVADVARQLGYEDANSLYYGIGVGERGVLDVIAVVDDLPAGQLDLLPNAPAVVHAAEGRSVALAVCCRPVEGCEIEAQIDGDTVIVHRVGCAASDGAVFTRWKRTEAERSYRVEIRGYDRPGLLHDVTAILLSDRASMDAMQASSDPGDNTARIAFDLTAHNLYGLARIIDRIRQVPGVIDANRIA